MGDDVLLLLVMLVSPMSLWTRCVFLITDRSRFSNRWRLDEDFFAVELRLSMNIRDIPETPVAKANRGSIDTNLEVSGPF